MKIGKRFGFLVLLAALVLSASFPGAARQSKIAETKHNLSSSGTFTTHSTTESQICVFCHTPHGAENRDGDGNANHTPLWNKTLGPSSTYTPYSSSSLDAATIQGASAGQPLGSSKLCLSCHDGVVALGSVRVLRGQLNQTISVSTDNSGKMPLGSGVTTGDTRLLGGNLTNDHPISVTYDSTLSNRDGELRTPDAGQAWGTVFGLRTSSFKPSLPLAPTGSSGKGQVQCTTCHDPHIKGTAAELTAEKNIKFLRLKRFQAVQPTDTYSASNDIICLACHDKSSPGGSIGGGKSWAYSAHANENVGDEAYTDTAADARDFPRGIKVWQAACLNCHDTHTLQGARRLLRQGASSGVSATEETCYQCHSASGTSIVTPLDKVPDIKSDFALTGSKMPITASDASSTEAHDINGNFNDATFVDCTTTTNKCGKDLIEPRSKLGVGTLTNRHAECPDCHNPHRVVKFKDFRGASGGGDITGAADASGTHPHTDTAMTHSNIASGVLRGTWGVEPVYSAASNPKSFHTLPSGYTVKRGDPGTSATAVVGDGYVTREYQICLKCHSDYGYTDNNTYPTGNRPNLGYTGGTPTTGSNGLTQYTNQAKEFQASSGHEGPINSNTCINVGNEAGANITNCNHRSWHPVMAATGRNLTTRNITSTNPWLAPWNNATGTQTMYCTDCHGTNTTSATSVIPDSGEDGKPWGPHGSGNAFILKGAWIDVTAQDTNLLCFKCHVRAVYTGGSDTGKRSGFYNSSKGNLHNYHAEKVNKFGKNLRCTWCHVAVPHGWKNKALLVNLNDVGLEAGNSTPQAIADSTIKSSGYSQQPYYWKATNKIVSFAKSGSWAVSNCGNGDIKWMNGSGSTPEGTCKSPP